MTQAPGAEAESSYLFYYERSRFDDRLSWPKRKLLAGGIAKDVELRLKKLKQELEQ